MCEAPLHGQSSIQDMPDAAVGPNDDRVGTPENLRRARKVCTEGMQAFCAELACGDGGWAVRLRGVAAGYLAT
jgi:hypothetical protein